MPERATSVSTTCASTAATPRSGGTTSGRGSLQLSLFGRRAAADRADGARRRGALVKKAYLYLNNHFSAQAVANAVMLRQLLDEPVTAPLPAELVGAFRCSKAECLLCPLHGYSDDAIVDLDLLDDVHAADHLAEHRVLPSSRGAAPA